MNKAWWKESVVYQIYPRSFQDSNGDGIGDLRGIINRLDYLKELGVDVIWLSPIYQSPNDDNGYDISDYRAIMAEFGTMADFEDLLEQLHHRGIRLLMDLVVNHTSDEHPWFVESRRSRDNPYREWYIWRPGRDGHEPNNWASLFGGSAWQYDEATDEYYLHLFSKKQPDLNWENPRVREAVHEMMHWWLKKGIDGFRMDAINLISKAPGLPDAPVKTANRYQFPGPHVFNGPRLLEFLGETKRRVLSHYDIFTVAETGLVTTEHGLDLTHEKSGPVNMLFQFEHVEMDMDDSSDSPRWDSKPWSLLELKRIMQPRSAARRFAFRRRWPLSGGVGQAARHLPAHPARHPLCLSGGRDRHDECRFSHHRRLSGHGDAEHVPGVRGGERYRSKSRHGGDPRQEPRQRAYPDAVGCQRQCGLQRRNSLDQGQPQLQ